MTHQILSPYTAFVGVETTGPKINTTNMKVRHVPIQISKGDEHLFSSPFAFHHSGLSGYRYAAYGPVYAAPMPMFGRGGSHGYLPRIVGAPSHLLGGA